MPFVHPITARLYDIDRGGIVFFGAYYRYCHDALEEMLAQMFDLPLEEAFSRGLWFSPVVHSEADYSHPIRLGERCLVALSVERLGVRSITYTYTISRIDGTLCATLRLVNVFVDPKTMKSVAVPEHFIAGLGRLGLWPLPG